MLIASPDAPHGPLTLDCVRQNRHVLCEKPLALNSAEAIFLNSAVHDIQSARWLREVEVKVEEAYTAGTNTDPSLGEDVFDLHIIQLSMSGGKLANIEVHMSAG